MKGEQRIRVEARRTKLGMLDFKETVIKDCVPVSAQIQSYVALDQPREENKL